MSISALTIEDCESVINMELPLGQICIPADDIDHKITYNPLTMIYSVTVNGEPYDNNFDRDAMLKVYNKLNEKVDL